MYFPRLLKGLSLLCLFAVPTVSNEFPPASSSGQVLRKHDEEAVTTPGALDEGLNLSHQAPDLSSARKLAEDDHDDHDDHDDDKPKPWGAVLGGTLLVNLATILGVVFLIPFCRKQQTDEKNILDILVPSFAAGALIATAVFLTTPESLVLIQTALTPEEDDHGDDHGDDHDRLLRLLEGDGDGHDDHEEEHGFEFLPGTIWRYGASLLAGFLIPRVIHMFFPNKGHSHGPAAASDDKVKEDEETASGSSTDASHVDTSLVLAVLFGDSLCNFVDGVFVGIAISMCNASIAWAVIGITFYHEVAQELADYFLLTRFAGLTPLKALTVNFCTGLSVVLGGFLVLLTTMSNMLIGVLLAIASGVYLYIAACECLPRVQGLIETQMEGLIVLLMFASGAIPIGLTLLGHVHCDAH